MKKKLIITLKSDLCVASGYSYAGVVDSDICYDRYGLPYIPARRLKGCFRDTCENILYSFVSEEQVKALFGVGGSDAGGILKISNAKLQNYESIRKEIISLKGNKKNKNIITQQKVLEQYTHIVAQTAIGEDDSAEDKSLRYTRVVNHYIPTQNGFQEMAFEAVIECDERFIKEGILELIVGATKHIGLKRNRGLGNVSCKLTDGLEKNGDSEAKLDVIYNQDDEYVITYSMTNDEPLMLSQLSDVHSEKYISGQSILGYLAGAYLRIPNASADTNEFKDLFLTGVTKYVNAYPAMIDEKGDAKIYYPAPLNINKLKKSKEYVDVLFPLPEDKSQPGNQPKKLKGKYVYQNISGASVNIDVKDVDMKLYYHHRKGEDSILYPSEALEPEQLFVGEIYTKGKYVDKIINLLNKKDFYFGKSKSAQYGHCVCEVKSVKPINSKQNLQNEIVITLLTDAIFHDDGEYTVDAKRIGELLCKCSGILDGCCKKIVMETGLVSGYQKTWNMHKPLYPVVKAGSCFVVKCKDTINLPDKIWVGTKNQEGYGYASVVPMQQRSINEINIESGCIDTTIPVDKFKPQYCSILKEELMKELLEKTINLRNITKTQISRAILMLKQSKDFSDFKRRVGSIKTTSVRNTLERELISIIGTNNVPDIGKLLADKAHDAAEIYATLTSMGADLSELWRDYLLYILTLCKYEAKED